MSYHSLSECTLTPEERFREKNEILSILHKDSDRIDMKAHEAKFCEQMKHATSVSVSQLFWLRDLKDKYL